MVQLPVPEDWLLNLDKRREEPGPPNSAHIMFPSLSHSVGDQGQPRTTKGSQGNQGQKTGKRSKGKFLNLKKSPKCINPMGFRIHPENSFIELREKLLMPLSKMIPDVLQLLRKLNFFFFLQAFLVLDEEDMPSSVLPCIPREKQLIEWKKGGRKRYHGKKDQWK